jgi:hypothetical protein
VVQFEDVIVRYDGQSRLLFLNVVTKEVLFVQKFLLGVVSEFNLRTILDMVGSKD